MPPALERESLRPLDQRDVAPIHHSLSDKIGTPGAADSHRKGARAFVAKLRRRGIDLGTICEPVHTRLPHNRRAQRSAYYRALWKRPQPFVIERALSDKLRLFQKDIRQSMTFLERIRSSESAVEWLEQGPYASRLRDRFDIVCALTDMGDPQEIQKIYLNAVAGEKILAQDLFIKVNYLSLYEKDASIRLRFSFGEEAFRDWKAWERDRKRSDCSAELALSVFPESALVVRNKSLKSLLQKITGHPVQFPERIIYSNAPDGGAFFHHDFVRSHSGVIFAQLRGLTGWLALPKTELVAAIKTFLTTPEFQPSLKRQFPRKKERDHILALGSSIRDLKNELECDAAGPLTELINNNAEFIGYLVRQGAMRILRPGDVLLLPAPRRETATWHSVFCLDDRPGLSLSFAIKKAG